MILFILPSLRTVSKLSKKIRTATIASTSSVFTHTRIPLFDLYTTGNEKSWCQVQNALKSVYFQDLILSDQYLTIKFQRKSSDS